MFVETKKKDMENIIKNQEDYKIQSYFFLKTKPHNINMVELLAKWLADHYCDITKIDAIEGVKGLPTEWKVTVGYNLSDAHHFASFLHELSKLTYKPEKDGLLGRTFEDDGKVFKIINWIKEGQNVKYMCLASEGGKRFHRTLYDYEIDKIL